MQLEDLNTLFKTHKEQALFGRYIHANNIKPLIKNLSSNFKVEVIGRSVNGEDIYSITVGSGSKRILMWSQMHGNESTSTKAIFDLINLFSGSVEGVNALLEDCSICIIPMLNPDGAKAYTRLNANGVDLNRDAQNLSQPESIMLKDSFNAFKPHYCLNLHGQRTIFSAGNSDNSATVSFLAPAQDEKCTITPKRKIAMAIISRMNTLLQQEIPNQIGIYDDAFNINCVGDTFQSLNVPTILFEAGHYSGDYEREETRYLIFKALLGSLKAIVDEGFDETEVESYLGIPQNNKLFFDIVIRNVKNNDGIKDVAIQYEERLVEGHLEFIPVVQKVGVLDSFYAHKELNASEKVVLNSQNNVLKVGDEMSFIELNDEILSLKPSKS